MLSIPTPGSLSPWHNAQMTPPGGRLYVPPAYYQTSSDAATQLNSINDGISIKWTQPVDMALTSWSLYVTAVGTQGDMNTLLRDITDGTGSETPLSDYGSSGYLLVDSGDTADVWVTETFDAVQLSRGRQYEFQVNGTAAADFSCSGRRWNTAQGSMFPDTCSSLYTTDKWSTPLALEQDSKPALLNVMFNSVEAEAGSPTPYLWYCREHGKYVYIPGTGLMTIPAAGVSLDCSALTAETLYYVYLYTSSGTMTLEATDTSPTTSDGLLVQTGATTKLFVGMIYPEEIISGDGYQGPVDVEDRRLVAYPGRCVSFKKLCPYSSATQQTVNAATGWVVLGTAATDLRLEYVGLPGDKICLSTQITCSGQHSAAWGVDSASYSESYPAVGGNDTVYENATLRLDAELDAGFHYLVPIYRNMHDSNASYPQLYRDEYGSSQYRFGRAAITGSIGGTK